LVRGVLILIATATTAATASSAAPSSTSTSATSIITVISLPTKKRTSVIIGFVSAATAQQIPTPNNKQIKADSLNSKRRGTYQEGALGGAGGAAAGWAAGFAADLERARDYLGAVRSGMNRACRHAH